MNRYVFTEEELRDAGLPHLKCSGCNRLCFPSGWTKTDAHCDACHRRILAEAAAPELLAALQAVAAFLAETDGRDELALGSIVYAAIAKAEGRQ